MTQTILRPAGVSVGTVRQESAGHPYYLEQESKRTLPKFLWLLLTFGAIVCGCNDLAPITISPNILPEGTVGVSYSVEFSAVSGSDAINCVWSIGGGQLPNGLSLTNEKDGQGNPNGKALLSGTPSKAGQFTFSVSCQDFGNGHGNTAPYTISIVQPTLSVTGYPSPVVAGTSNNFTVTAKDTSGNVDTSYTGTVRLSSSDALVIFPVTTYTFVAVDKGVHSFSATLNTVGSQSITATDTITSSITGTQSGIVVNSPAGAPSKLAFAQQPTNVAAGASIAPAVTVNIEDSSSNTVTTATNPVTIAIGANPSNGTLSGTKTVAAVGGVATFANLSIDKAGIGYTLTVSAAGLSGATSNGFNVIAGTTATHFAVAAPATATVGSAFNFTITAQDASNNTVSGYTGTVHFTTSDPNPSVVLPVNYTFASADAGTHTFTATLKTIGDQTITATDTISSTLTGTSNTITVSFVQSDILTPGSRASLNDDGTIAVTGGGSQANVFTKSGNSWLRTQLTNAAGVTSVVSVAISGDGQTVVIGDCSAPPCDGNAYVYVEPPGGWPSGGAVASTATISASAGARFGYVVAIDHGGDTIVVGSPNEITMGAAGAAYVFVRPGNTWANTKTSDAQLTFNSGISVSIDSTGDTIATGGTSTNSIEPNVPVAVYVRKAGWQNAGTIATPTASISPLVTEFGFAVAISGDGNTLVVGAPQSGSAYVFVANAAVWSDRTAADAVLAPKDGQAGDAFGLTTSVSNDGGTVVVGATFQNTSGPTPGPGAAYVFTKPAGGWVSGGQTFQESPGGELTPSAGVDILGDMVTPNGNFSPQQGLCISNDASTIAIGGSAKTGSSPLTVVYIF